MTFPDLVLTAVASACATNDDVEHTRASVRAVLEAAPSEGERAREDALEQLAHGIAQAPDIERAAAIALAVGALVEEGASPTIALPAVLGRLPRALAAAAQFVEACLADDDAAEGNERNCIERCGAHVSSIMPEEARAFRSIENLCLAAVAMLARSKDARRTLPGKESLLALVSPLCDWQSAARWLAATLHVQDDVPLVAIHPASRRGFVVRISGVCTVDQLHTLLLDVLVGDPSRGRLPGTRPDPLVVAAAKGEPTLFPPPAATSGFRLAQWYGIGDEDAASDLEHAPAADIARFEGLRTVLLVDLVDADRPASWPAERALSGMRAEVELVETLSEAEVDARLHRMAAAPRED